jgi:hypothetical protein
MLDVTACSIHLEANMKTPAKTLKANFRRPKALEEERGK